MSRATIELGRGLFLHTIVWSIALVGVVGCSQQVPQDNVATKESSGPLSVDPVAPIGSNEPSQAVPSPTPTPGSSPSPTPAPSASACAASSSLSWMIQDVSYTIDFAGSNERRSYLCRGQVPETAVGTSIEVSSTNGNTGSIRLNCTLVSGAPQWRVTVSHDASTGAPVGSSCGMYDSSYRPASLLKVRYIRAASLQTDGPQSMFGISMMARSYYSGTGDHLFSVDKTEGPNAGYRLEGLGFNVLHLASSQDNGGAANSIAPSGLIKIHRCNNPLRGRHYMTIGSCNEVQGDVYEGSRYIFQNPSLPALGVTKVALYRCRTSSVDLVTPLLAECTGVGGTATLIGYTVQ